MTADLKIIQQAASKKHKSDGALTIKKVFKGWKENFASRLLDDERKKGQI